jgi:predicted SAM-dependent methyltransferase
MDKQRLQILDIGCGPDPIAPIVFQPIIEQGYEYDLTTIDINPANNPNYVHDIRNPFPPELIGKFDLVLASHVFEHIERHVALPTFKNMADTLAKDGELWVVVPSLEWCADEIRNGRNTAAVWLCLYGGGEPNMPSTWYHNMGYTLMMLRDVFKSAGLIVRKAYQTPLLLPFKRADGAEHTFHALQNVVIGVKVDDPIVTVG